MSDYLAAYLPPDASENTRRAYQADWRHFQGWLAASGMSLDSLGGNQMLEDYRDDLLTAGYAPATVARKLVSVGRLTGVKGVVAPQRHEGTKKQTRGKRTLTLTAEETARVLALPDLRTATGVRDAALLEVVLACGVKISEAARLTVDDVDGIAMLLCTSRAKTGMWRWTPMTGGALTALYRWLTVRRSAGPQGTALFVGLHNGSTGAALGERGARWIVEKYVRKVKVTG